MKEIKGIAASPGIAIGPIFVYRPAELVIHNLQAEDASLEWERYQNAAQKALLELVALRQKVASEVGEEDAAIFDAHQMILRDPDLEEELRAEIDTGASAESATEVVFARQVKSFEEIDDPLFRERAADFSDVGRRVLCILTGVQDNALAALDAPAIVIAKDLMPSDTAQMNKAMVRGFCTAGGGPLSHTAILARNLGLPAVVGAGKDVLDLKNGEWLVVDGGAGVVVIGADEQQCNQYQQEADRLAQERATAQAHAHEPAITQDGRQIEVVANVGLPGEEVDALQAGAEGIGLLRTEFLFVERRVAPSEEEQYQAYYPIFDAMGERIVIARTLDIGGDKPVPFLAVPHEDNPYLGWRAIRIGLADPELLKTQLRALLRAGHNHNLKIMFPMIATVEEMQAARALVDEARAELAERGAPYAQTIDVGTMIEVPSAALMADQLVRYVDFFSIGSNDLTQYTLAADRGNPAVASLSDALHPAVLRLVDNVVRAAHAAGVWVGVCGEMAGDPNAIPLLLGLGVDEFSAGVAAIPATKALIRKLSLVEAQELAHEALAQPGAPAVHALVKRWMEEH